MTEQNSVFDTSYKGEITTKTRNVTQLKVMYKIVDVESGESQIIVGFGNGADSQDKGSGKAFTYSLKTALSKTFMLFSGEDTDNTHSDDIGHPSKPVFTPNVPKSTTQLECNCIKCHKKITNAVNKFSLSKFKKPLCQDCQKLEG